MILRLSLIGEVLSLPIFISISSTRKSKVIDIQIRRKEFVHRKKKKQRYDYDQIDGKDDEGFAFHISSIYYTCRMKKYQIQKKGENMDISFEGIH